MFDDVIKFTKRSRDLDRTDEYWQGESYASREESIRRAIQEKSGFPPSPNMQYVKEGTFRIKAETTLAAVVSLARQIRELYRMDCFQVSIDRETGLAHLLFDRNDRTRGRIVHLNRTEQIVLSVFILRSLGLPRPEGTELWLRYFLTAEFSDSSEVFSNLLASLKHARLGKKNYRLVRDVVTYVEQMCQGLVK